MKILTMLSWLFVCLALPPTVFGQACPKWHSAEAVANIKNLTLQIRHHDDLYFNQYAPVISDSEYDQLTHQLALWKCCFPNRTEQPETKTSAKYVIRHHAPMGSLKKANDKDDIQRFLTAVHGQELLVQPKIDGIAVELVYDQGKLVSASTRGNGEYGAAILRHIRHIPTIPKAIQYSDSMVLHGELFIRLDQIPTKMLHQSASARHLIAGLINRQKPAGDKLQYAEFFPWSWINHPYDNDQQANTHLATIGFGLLEQHTQKATSFEDITTIRQAYQHANTSPFLVDGIVIKAGQRVFQKNMGWASKTPNWAIAWKFPAKEAITQVRNIEFSTGKTGRVTPVLVVNPTNINGKIISRVSLGSVNNFSSKDIAIGDQISIGLKGEAIPVFRENAFPA